MEDIVSYANSIFDKSIQCIKQAHFDIAKRNLDELINGFADDHRYRFWRMMANYQCKNIFELIDKAIPIHNDPDFCRACHIAPEEQKKKYEILDRQVLFSTHLKCQEYLDLLWRDRWDIAAHWMDCYLENSSEDDPYRKIYECFRKIPYSDWTVELLIGQMIYLHSVYQEQLKKGLIIASKQDEFPSDIPNAVTVPSRFLATNLKIHSLLTTQKAEDVLCIHTRKKVEDVPNHPKPKELKDPIYTLQSYDRANNLLRKAYYKKSTADLKNYILSGGPHIVKSTEVPWYHYNPLRCWCEPDKLFCIGAGIPRIPLPKSYIEPNFPTEPWERYELLSQQLKDPNQQKYCLEQAEKLKTSDQYL